MGGARSRMAHRLSARQRKAHTRTALKRTAFTRTACTQPARHTDACSACARPCAREARGANARQGQRGRTDVCRRCSPAVTVPVAGRGGQPPGRTLGLPNSNRDVRGRCVRYMCDALRFSLASRMQHGCGGDVSRCPHGSSSASRSLSRAAEHCPAVTEASRPDQCIVSGRPSHPHRNGSGG